MDSTIVAAAIGVVGSLLGGIAGGFMAVRASQSATKEAFENRLALQNAVQNQAIRGVLLGLQTEINSLRFVYESDFAPECILELREGEAFKYHYPVSRNYFTIYEGNGPLIGQIPDDELRVLVIKTYYRMKGLIDIHQYNNELLKNCKQIAEQQLTPEKTQLLKPMLQDAEQKLNEYGINIKNGYSELIKLVDEFNDKIGPVVSSLSKSQSVKIKT